MSETKNKYRRRISSSLDPELWKSLEEMSARSDVPISRLIDRAIKLLLEQEKSEE